MNLIDMSDREKMFYYAKKFIPDRLRVFDSERNADSFYNNSGESGDIHDLAIMEYSIERFDILKKSLLDMWSKAGLKNPELLATMVSAMTLKNMPLKKEQEVEEGLDVLQYAAKKESYESVNTDDAPPVFVYEF